MDGCLSADDSLIKKFLYAPSSERLGDFKLQTCNPALQNALEYIN
jgi:hypothetical protein